jgi:hypothetical protein
MFGSCYVPENFRVVIHQIHYLFGFIHNSERLGVLSGDAGYNLHSSGITSF